MGYFGYCHLNQITFLVAIVFCPVLFLCFCIYKDAKHTKPTPDAIQSQDTSNGQFEIEIPDRNCETAHNHHHDANDEGHADGRHKKEEYLVRGDNGDMMMEGVTEIVIKP